MNTRMLWDMFGWGFVLWLFGYILGFLFFAFVPTDLIGWAIMPLGVAVTLWVLFRKIRRTAVREYVCIGIAWAAIAMVCDYVFLVQLLHPADGYYKLDVYLYYVLTLLLPVLIGWWKITRNKDEGVDASSAT